MLLVVFSPYQEKQVASGLYIANKIADFIFDPLLFFPLLFLIFIYALTYFSFHISTGRMGYLSVVLYLFLSSIVVFLVRNKGEVEIHNVVILTRDAGKYATEVEENDNIVVRYAGTLPPTETQRGLIKNVPYIADMFSFFDPIITGIYVASFGVDEWDIKNVDRGNCLNPESVFRYAVSYPFMYVMEDLKESGKVNACYASLLSSFAQQLRDTQKEAQRTGKPAGEILWDKVNAFKIPFPVINTCSEVLGAWGAGNFFWIAVEHGLNERLSQCEAEFGAEGYDKDRMRSLVGEYVVRHGEQVVQNFLAVVYPNLSDLTRPIKQAGTSALVNIGNLLQGTVKSIANFMNRNLNYSFDTKITLFSIMQGVAQGLLIAFAPLVAILSLIPVGGSIINYKLLIGYFIAYFLVSLWVPILWLIYVMVWGRAFVSALQHVF